MKKQFIPLSVIFALFIFSLPVSGQFKSLEEALPKILSQYNVVKHSAYILEYSEVHEQARWVLYMLKKDQAAGVIEKTDNFCADPLVRTGYASLPNYKGKDKASGKSAN